MQKIRNTNYMTKKIHIYQVNSTNMTVSEFGVVSHFVSNTSTHLVGFELIVYSRIGAVGTWLFPKFLKSVLILFLFPRTLWLGSTGPKFLKLEPEVSNPRFSEFFKQNINWPILGHMCWHGQTWLVFRIKYLVGHFSNYKNRFYEKNILTRI